MSDNYENVKDNKYYEKIQKMQLFHDEFFRVAIDGNTDVMKLILNILFERENMKVTGFQKQREIKGLKGHSVFLDVMAYDDDGIVYDLEIQKKKEGSLSQRSEYYSGMLNALLLESGQDYSDLKPSYVIFFMEKDVFGEGLPLYKFSMHEDDTYAILGGGHHIIFVNGDNTDVDTRLGKLVHDFKCTSSRDMFYEVLAARVHYLKETKGGIKQMSDIFEQVEKRGRIFGVIDTDRCHHMDDDEIIVDLMEVYHLTRDMAEEYLQEYYAECSVPT